MESTSEPGSIVTRNEEFWLDHQEKLELMRLSRSHYCRQYNLNYNRFSYWAKRRKRNGCGKKLVPIKIKPVSVPSQVTLLGTLNLKNGHQLKIHDAKALSVILDRLS